jgi:hypothetical protein
MIITAAQPKRAKMVRNSPVVNVLADDSSDEYNSDIDESIEEQNNQDSTSSGAASNSKRKDGANPKANGKSKTGAKADSKDSTSLGDQCMCICACTYYARLSSVFVYAYYGC